MVAGATEWCLQERALQCSNSKCETILEVSVDDPRFFGELGLADLTLALADPLGPEKWPYPSFGSVSDVV